MNRDFATSWEQKRWQTACRSHDFYSRGLLILRTEEMKQRCKQRLEELEAEFPMLKKKAGTY